MVIQVRCSVCESSGNLHLKDLEDTLGSYGTGRVSPLVFIFSQFPRRGRTGSGLKRN